MDSLCRRSLAVAIVAVSLTAPTASASGPIAVASFRDRDCSDFNTQAQAQRFFERHHPNRDPHGLDADHDGIACEDLP